MTAAGSLSSNPGTWRSPSGVWPAWQLMAMMIVAMAAAGCSSGRDAGRIRVAGSVSFDGKPLGHGAVLFARTGDRDVASTPIRAGGAFTVALLPGDYDVAVRCFAAADSTQTSADWESPKSLIPEKYVDAATSGLKVTAAAGMPPIRLELAR